MRFLYVLLVGVFYSKQADCAFPSDKITQCKVGDSECIKDVVTNDVTRKLYTGLKEINLGSLDPLLINRLAIENGGQSPVRIKLYFNDVKLLGLSKGTMTKLTGLKSDFKDSKFNFEVKSPHTIMLGKYKINGQVLILPIQGEGNSNMTFLDPVLRFKSTLKSVEKDGKEYAQIDKASISINISKLIVNFTNLFNGNKELGDTMNRFLNENWSEIFQELKASVEKAFVKVVKDYINDVFMSTPYKQLFKE